MEILFEENPGLLFFCRINRRHRHFVCSRLNSFGGFVSELVLVDGGCNSILIPLLETADLHRLQTLFPTENLFRWRISQGTGTAGVSLVLIVESTRPFDVRLCGRDTFRLNSLRFHLCHEDLNEIYFHRDVFQTFLSAGCFDLIAAHNRPSLLRRHYTLLGQAVLRQCSQVHHGDHSLYVDAVEFGRGVDIWTHFDLLTRRIDTVIVTQPEFQPPGIDDVDDDDHIAGDNEDIRDSLITLMD